MPRVVPTYVRELSVECFMQTENACATFEVHGAYSVYVVYIVDGIDIGNTQYLGSVEL